MEMGHVGLLVAAQIHKELQLAICTGSWMRTLTISHGAGVVTQPSDPGIPGIEL